MGSVLEHQQPFSSANHAHNCALVGSSPTDVKIGRKRTLNRSSTKGASIARRVALTSMLAVMLVGCNRNEGRATSDQSPTTAPSSSASVSPLGVGTVYTADEGGGSLSQTDLATGQVTTFPIGVLPHNVQISADGRRILAVGSLPGAMKGMGNESNAAPQPQQASRAKTAEPPGQLLVLDAVASDGAGAVRIPVGRKPAHVIADAEGDTAYITSAEENAVDIIDLAKGRVIGRIATAASPHGLRASPDGRKRRLSTGPRKPKGACPRACRPRPCPGRLSSRW